MTVFTFIIAALAVARLTSLIVHDDIAHSFRDRVWKWSPPNELPEDAWYTRSMGAVDRNLNPIYREPGFVGRLIQCSHCTAVWVAIVAYASIQLFPDSVVLPVLTIAALAQVSEAAIKASR